MNALALPTTVADIVDEYAMKVASLDTNITEFQDALNRMKSASVVQGTYVERVVDDVYLRPDSIRMNLRKSGWKAVYGRLQIERLASAKDKRLFEMTLANPPDLTLDNAKATFADYLLRPRYHALRALAECFVDLDPAYKSHSRVKIGVSGLPNRVILSSVGGYSSYGRDRLRDILNALAAVQNLPMVEHEEMQQLDSLHRIGEHQAGVIAFDGTPIKRYVSGGKDEMWAPPARGVTLKKYGNGNGHVIFDVATLLAINRGLAEFYGEVLPDAEDEEPVAKRASTDVAKDLQFYPTPRKVVETVLDEIGLYAVNPSDIYGNRTTQKSVLEPSCGDGQMMDVIRERGRYCYGVEVHAERADTAKRKGHSILVANFLEQPCNQRNFDFVILNPPFYGTHWKKHLAHAMKFVKPDGIVACILPASAEYDHEVSKEIGGKWHDLPVASFAESGTNIPTGFVVLQVT